MYLNENQWIFLQKPIVRILNLKILIKILNKTVINLFIFQTISI